jgi:predicted lactoylglutathione lyase
MTNASKRQANRVATGAKAMAQMIFVNLPVEDLERSKRFYEAIGFRNEPKFTNEAAAMMVLSDTSR